jgi:hypothetical protein
MRTEHDEQKALIKWFDLQYRELRGRLAAVPNASKCPVYVGAKMNAEGRRKGYPDLQLLTPRAGYHGLIIEMKNADGGSVSPEQKDFLQWLNEQGYLAVVCNGFEEARAVIDNYLSKEAKAA